MPSPKPNTAKGKAAGALGRPVQPDAVLAAVVGSGPLPRTGITKKVWKYIRSHHLQDPQNRRNINADENLQALFGGQTQATMFELTKYVSQHIA